MTKFTYDDMVVLTDPPSGNARRGARASVIAVFPDRASRPGPAFSHFPDGAVYTVEFEDGSTAEVHELWLQPLQ